jgi:hypothetical protein
MRDFTCLECGLAYVRESPEDRKLHRACHDEVVNGVPAHPTKPENVIWRESDDRIIVVTPLSPKAQRVRARKVARVANREVLYDFGLYDESEPPDERNLHLFLYCRGSRVVGLAMLEKRSHVCHYTWEEYDRQERKTLEERSPVWSLGFAWVHRKHRRSSIARTLFHESLRFLGIDSRSVGVYTPFSADGERFARALFPHGFLVAK